MTYDRATRMALAEEATGNVAAGFAAVLGERLAIEPGARRPNVYDHGMVVSPHDLLERCPSRAAQPMTGDFVWSARTAERQIGLGALRLLDDDSTGVHELGPAVTEVLANRSALGRSLADWVDDLGPAGLAAVSAAALTWAAGLLRVVPRDRKARWADPAQKAKWDHPDRLVQVVAAHDASMGGMSTGEVLLLVADTDTDSTVRMRAAHLALVRAMQSGHAPVRVTVASPSRGAKVRVDVNRELLALAVDRVVEHVALRADPSSALTRPGRWCTHCHLIEVCEAHV